MTIPYILLADRTWGDLFSDVLQQPQRYLFWVIIFLIVLFALSRLNNYMEVRGVDRAIYITRGLVGTIMYFLIAPIVFFIILNIIAIIYGVPTIDVSFLGKWIGLTFSSYWWLLKCFFGSSDISGNPDLYNIHSIIRILWILIPITFIWLRMTSGRVGKLLLIPFVIGVLVITRHKSADETFITKDLNPAMIQRVPIINWFVSDPATKNGRTARENESNLTSGQRKVVAGLLMLVTIAGMVVGLYLQYRVVGLIIIIIGVLGFLLLAPSQPQKTIPAHIEKHYNVDLDSLINRMDSIYKADTTSVEIYELSLKIDAAYKALYQTDLMIEFPDSLCRKYKVYFYDWCDE